MGKTLMVILTVLVLLLLIYHAPTSASNVEAIDSSQTVVMEEPVHRTVSCQFTGTALEGWYYNNEEVIDKTDCRGCQALYQFTGTLDEGWYSSCDGRLIVLAN